MEQPTDRPSGKQSQPRAPVTDHTPSRHPPEKEDCFLTVTIKNDQQRIIVQLFCNSPEDKGNLKRDSIHGYVKEKLIRDAITVEDITQKQSKKK